MIYSLLLVAAVSMAHRALGRDIAAWRFDLKFDSVCGADFSVLGAMLFNGKGKKSGRIYSGIVHQPFLYAELDETPDLRTSKITIRLEVMTELENVMFSPREILRFQISLLHLRDTHKFQLSNSIRLKNDTVDYTRMSVEFDVELSWFKRMEKSDCYYDKTYYQHGEIANSGFQCKQFLICRCDNGVISQNCEVVPQTCYHNGGYYDKHTISVICSWKMQTCCPEVDCPVEPLTYCLNVASETTDQILCFFCTLFFAFSFLLFR